MSQQAAKEYLQRAYYLDREIRLEKEKLKKMRGELYGGTQHCQYSDGKGGSHGSFENGVQKVVDCEGEINRKISALTEQRAEIERTIRAVADATERELLERRYLLYQKWKEIAAEMSYSERHIYDLHKSALKNISVNLSKSHLTAV